MAGPRQEWIPCVLPAEKRIFPGAKIHYTECVFCPVVHCDRKGIVFSWFFPRDITLDDTRLNRKLVAMNVDNHERKRARMRRFCPVRRAKSRGCTGMKNFCRYNTICGRYMGDERNSELFIRSIRWRETMMYVVKFNDGTVKAMKKSEFKSVDIDDVDKVFTGNYEVKVVSELVPKGEERDHFDDMLATFRDKYKGCVVNGDGIVTFGEWFEEASVGESAVIPGKILVPQKKYKVVRIKEPVDLRKMGISENEALFMEETEKEKKRREKNKQATADSPDSGKKTAKKPAKKPVKKSAKKRTAASVKRGGTGTSKKKTRPKKTSSGKRTTRKKQTGGKK